MTHFSRTARGLGARVAACALLTLAALSAPLAAAPIQWPAAAGGNGHFYEVVDVGSFVSWLEAEAAAQLAGGYLVTITSAEENDFVTALTAGLEAYIGLTDAAEEGVFVWVTGEPFVFSNWAFGEPNDDIAPASPTGEDYVIINPPNNPLGTWNDLPNNSFRVTAYVIEYDTQPVPEPAAVLLLGSALAIGAARKRAKRRG